jgi:hypothetical protein
MLTSWFLAGIKIVGGYLGTRHSEKDEEAGHVGIVVL